MTQKTISGIVDWLKGWFAPIDHSSTNTTYGVASTSKYGHVMIDSAPTQNEGSKVVSSGAIYTALTGKSNTGHGHGNIDKDGKIGNTTGLPLKTGSGGLVTTGAFGSGSGQFAEGNHHHGNLSSSGTVSSTIQPDDISNVVVTDSNGNLRIISQLPQMKMNTSNFYLGTPQVVESDALSHLGTSQASTQHAVNVAIDEKIGQLMGVEFVRTVTSLPEAKASTMNAIYLVTGSGTSSGDAFEFYVTIRSGTDPNYTYAWERIDDATLKGFLTKSVADGYYSPLSHSHYVSYVGSQNQIMVKAGCSYNNVLSSLAQDTSLDSVLQAFGNAIGNAKTGGQIKSVTFVPKSTDNTGSITITYNDE